MTGRTPAPPPAPRPAEAPSAPGRVSQATREFCAEQAKGVTAWPFEQIEQAVQPTERAEDAARQT